MCIDDGATFFVYVDRTADTGEQFYVGKGNVWRLHDNRRNKKHASVMKKHGIRRVIAFETTNEQLALFVEIQLIRELHTYVHDASAVLHAANFTLGGESTSGRVPSEASRAKSRASQIGKKRKPHLPETRAKQSVSATKRWQHDNTTREKMSELARREVDQLLDGKVIATFPSMRAAAESTGVYYSNISQCCCGTRKHTRGFSWRYKDGGMPEPRQSRMRCCSLCNQPGHYRTSCSTMKGDTHV